MRHCIINAAYGKWYPRGQKRLLESLKNVKYSGDIFHFCDEQINEHFDPLYPYTIKAAALSHVIERNIYDVVLWLDCSVWAIKNPDSFMDIINHEGCYFWKSGFNLAQTAADSDLEWAGITRDQAENITECASSMFAFKPFTEKGRIFYDTFMSANKAGVCSTSRLHDNQSTDKRFMFARQDQTAATIAIHKAGYSKIYDHDVYSSYHYDNKILNNSIYFLMRGM